VIRDSNSDFRINPDTDDRRIYPKMWMHYLVGVSHFAKYGTNRPLIAWQMVRMSKKTLFRNGEKNEKVSRNPDRDLDHHQTLITSRGSYLAHASDACQVWSTSVFVFVSCSVYRMTEWQTERSHNVCLVGGGINIRHFIRLRNMATRETAPNVARSKMFNPT